jgi:transcriptional regulator
VTSSDRPPPREDTETARARLAAALHDGPATVRELSERTHLSEKEVLQHLEHVARSLAARGQTLEIEAARCLACGFVFEERARLSKPGRCPACKGTRVSRPRYFVRG